MRYLLYFVVTISMAGCFGTMNIYKEPTSGELSTITFINVNRPTKYSQNTDRRKVTGFGVFGYTNGANCSGGQFYFSNKPKLLPGEKITTSIEANKEFSFRLASETISGLTSYICPLPPITFIPEKNRNYIAKVYISNQKCYFNLLEINNNGKEFSVEHRKRVLKMPFTASGEFCE